MKLLVGVWIAFLLFSTTANAEPDRTKSPTTAKVLAYVGTFAAPALGLTNLANDMDTPEARRIGWTMVGVESALMVLGPSAGHWYTGQVFTKAMAVRAGGAALTAAGLVLFTQCAQPDADCHRDDPEPYLTVGLFTSGMVALIAGTIWDVFDAPRAAERWNARRVMVAPLLDKDSCGLAFVGQF